MIQDVVTPRGRYRLTLMSRGASWSAHLPGGDVAEAWQRPDGRVVVRAPAEDALRTARFMLALETDTEPFHARFARDPLLGASARAFVGYRPPRAPTVAHAVVRAFSGQLIQASRARQIERAITRASDGCRVATQDGLLRLSAAELRACGLGQQRASGLARLVRAGDLERLHAFPTESVRARLQRERSVGPWSIGVIAMEGLGRYDHGLVGDLGLIKLATALLGRPADAADTAELLARYGEWQGLAGDVLMLGWGKGLIPGADRDRVRITRIRARRAA